MYKCSKCNKGVLVEGLEKPIRYCDCTTETIDSEGNKITKPATIILDMEAYNLKGHSNLQ